MILPMLSIINWGFKDNYNDDIQVHRNEIIIHPLSKAYYSICGIGEYLSPYIKEIEY